MEPISAVTTLEDGRQWLAAALTINYSDVEYIHFFHMNVRPVVGSGKAALNVGFWVK